MKRIHAAAAFLWAASAAFLAASPLPAAAAPPLCLPAAEADAALRVRHGEAPAGMGVANGRLVLLYRSRDGTTWTVTVADPQSGLMCILAAGRDWEALEPPPAGEPA